MARWSIIPPLPGEDPLAVLTRVSQDLNLILAEQEQDLLAVRGQGGYTAQFFNDVDMQGNRIRGLPAKPQSDDEALSQRYAKSGSFLYSEGDTFLTDKPIEHEPATKGTQSVTLSQLEDILAKRLATAIPAGIIVIWKGAIADIPAGWALCDGNSGTEDLRNYFIPGAGDDYAVDDTGGTDLLNLAHTHGPGTLATNTAGIHHHSPGTLATDVPTTTQVVQSGTGVTVAAQDHHHAITGVTSDDGTHGHDITSGVTASALSATTENRPRFFAKAYIQKL